MTHRLKRQKNGNEERIYNLIDFKLKLETESFALIQTKDSHFEDLYLVASNSIKLTGSELSKCLKLIDLLEDHDDVQKVYSNVDFDITEISEN